MPKWYLPGTPFIVLINWFGRRNDSKDALYWMNSKFYCTLGLSWICLFFFFPLPYSNRKNEFWKQFTNGAINTEQNTNNIKYQIIILAASTRSYRTLQLLQHLMITPLYLGDSKTSVVLITGSFVPLLVNSRCMSLTRHCPQLSDV